MNLACVRAFALSLPETTEAAHFERTSFRVSGKIFATTRPEGTRVNVFVNENEVHALVAESPAAFQALWWGKRLCGVTIDLTVAKDDVVREVLEGAWRGKAPKRLLQGKP